MYSPVSISLTNFMSHEDTYYEFIQGETTLIYGTNHDDDGADSNGSGKSAIVKGITIALLDVPDTTLNKEDYIQDGYTSCHLSLVLNDPANNLGLRIDRKITKSGSTVTVWENDVENRQLTSVREANARILELIGISREDLLNYFFINQDNSHSFFEATDTEQKMVVSRFTNSSLIDSSIAKVDEDLKQLNFDTNDLKLDIGEAERKIEGLNENVEYELNERKSEYKEKAGRLQDKLENLKKKQVANIQTIGAYELNIQELTKTLAKFKVIDVKGDKTKLADLQSKYEKIVDEIDESRKLLSEVRLQLGGAVKCPECGHEWTLEKSDMSVEDLRTTQTELEQIVESTKQSKIKLQEIIDAVDEKVKSGLQSVRQKQTLEHKVETINLDIEHVNKAVAGIRDEITEVTAEIAQLKQFSVNSARIEALRKDISVQEQIVAEKQEKLGKLVAKHELLNFWKINLGIRGFKTFLVNKVLTSLEGYVNYHLKQFKTNLQVKINGFRKNKGGEISEKIDILVSRDGDTWKKYKRHSGGQRQRINVCGILTIHKLINLSCETGGLNFLMLDEFFEGLDARGQTEILAILKQTGVTTLVISHNNTDIGAEHQLWLNYQNGVTQLA